MLPTCQNCHKSDGTNTLYTRHGSNDPRAFCFECDKSRMGPGERVAVPVTEAVDHPKHYNSHPAGVECITVIEAWSFNLGSAVKYIWRHGLKPGTDALTDLRKARWRAGTSIARSRG